MALSVKFALLTCLFFTGGLCWLVNQVSRPADGHGPNIALRADALVPSTPKSIPDLTKRSAQLERESPVARAHDQAETGTRTVVIADAELAGDNGDRPVPPLHNPLLEMRAAAEAAALATAPRGAQDTRHVPDAVFAMETAPNGLLEARRASDSYKAQKGDSLAKICRTFYGAQAAAGEKLLLAENPQVARRRGHTIQLGETLRIPELGGVGPDATDSGGMEASASFVTTIVPEPGAGIRDTETKPARPERTRSASGTIKSPGKSAIAANDAKPARSKPAAKSTPARKAGREVASALTSNAKGQGGPRGGAMSPKTSKTPPVAARRDAAPVKGGVGKRASGTDKRDARKGGSGGIVLAKRD